LLKEPLCAAAAFFAASSVAAGFGRAAAADAQIAGSSRKFGTIDAAMRHAVDTGVAAGVVAVGASMDGLVYQGAFGTANAHAGTPVSLDTVFWLFDDQGVYRRGLHAACRARAAAPRS
jgi:methyl acetate hydrolase